MQEALNFWNANSDNIIISLLVGLVFFVLGPLGLWFSGRKIRKERIRKAKEMLIDLVEGMIVNQEQITNSKLRKVFRAVEREVEVSIDSDYDLERLFEDVILRFQRSKHLDPAQKDTYSKSLTELSDSLTKSEEESGKRIIPRRYKDILDDIKEVALESNPEKAPKLIEELEERLSRLPSDTDPVLRLLTIQKRMIREHPVLLAVISIGYLVFIVLLISGVIK